MFEEYSKKYVDENYYDLIEQVQQVAYQSHQDGINFGYNQARKEMNDIGLALQSDMDKTIGQNLELKREIEELEKENAELKELHESDKKSLALIAKKGAELEKDYEVLSVSVQPIFKHFLLKQFLEE